MRTAIALLLLASTAMAGQNRIWTVRTIEKTTTAPQKTSTPKAAPPKLPPKLLKAMLDHSESMASYSMKYGVAQHGNRAVLNAHQSFVAAIRKRDPDARLREKYETTVTLYKKWCAKDQGQTVTDRYGNPLNR